MAAFCSDLLEKKIAQIIRSQIHFGKPKHYVSILHWNSSSCSSASRILFYMSWKWKGKKMKIFSLYLHSIVGPAEHFLKSFFIYHWWLGPITHIIRRTHHYQLIFCFYFLSFQFSDSLFNVYCCFWNGDSSYCTKQQHGCLFVWFRRQEKTCCLKINIMSLTLGYLNFLLRRRFRLISTLKTSM